MLGFHPSYHGAMMLEAAVEDAAKLESTGGVKIAEDVSMVIITGTDVELGTGVDLREMVFLDQIDESTWVLPPHT